MSHPWPAKKTLVIHSRGSERELGRHHAECLGTEVRDGMAGFYYRFFKRMFESKPKGLVSRMAFSMVKQLIDPILVNQLMKQVPFEMQERLRGVSEVSGVPYEQLAVPLVLPDLLPMLQAYAGKIRAVNLIDVTPPPLFGCSSFLSRGELFLQGRNLDFPGVAYWDRYPVIQMFAPSKGLRYIGFTSAGVPIAGITGVNEAQISVALHQHYCLQTNLKGQLPFVIGERILKEAHNLEDAIAILKASKVASSWAFVVADGKARDGFIYECHPTAAGIRRLSEGQGVLTHSNFFQTPATRSQEYATTERMNWDNYSRSKQLENRVRECQGKMGIPEAVKAISDHFDPYWQEEKIINRTVSQVYNIQSLVLDVSNMKVYLAEGDAPIHLRKYQEYNLGTIFGGAEGRGELQFSAYEFKSQAKRKAKESYILSFVSAFDGNFDAALEELKRCMELDYCAEAGFVAGILYMKRGEYDSALAELTKAKEFIESKKTVKGLKQSPPEFFEIWLYMARCLDLLGRRREAVAEYQTLAVQPDLQDQNLKRIAGKKGPYHKEHLDRILMPYSSYIPFS